MVLIGGLNPRPKVTTAYFTFRKVMRFCETLLYLARPAAEGHSPFLRDAFEAPRDMHSAFDSIFWDCAVPTPFAVQKC